VDGHIRSDVAVHETSVICEFLRQFPLFADLQTSTLTEVADKMMVEEAGPGDTVIRQGDPGELFYLIRSGGVDVLVEHDGESRKVAELGQGQYFGEAALLRDEPRNATIVAREKSVFYTLGKADFKGVLARSKSFVDELRNVLASRT
jgi:putative ABC transport system ATP-binding protein